MTTKATITAPHPADHFAFTHRIQVHLLALQRGAFVLRDNHHIWLIHRDKAGTAYTRYLCFSPSYDSLWRIAFDLLNAADFKLENLEYRIGATGANSTVELYNPQTETIRTLSRDDCRDRNRPRKVADGT